MKARTTGTYVLIAVAALATVGIVLSRPLSVEAVYPIERARQFVSRSVLPRIAGLFAGASARAENVRLRREVDSLALARQDLERLEIENARLRRALDYAAKMPEKWVSAGVLSRGGGAAAAGKTIRVDKGTLDGIKVDSVVVVPEGLVGLVTAVSPHTAEVTLVTDPDLKVACEIETGETVPPRGILSGGTEDVLVLRHLTKADRAAPRARVLTSGLGGIYPRGLEVGVWLDEDGQGENRQVRGGFVQPSVDFDALEDVFIRREK